MNAAILADNGSILFTAAASGRRLARGRPYVVVSPLVSDADVRALLAAKANEGSRT